MEPSYRILHIDDHGLFRTGLNLILVQQPCVQSVIESDNLLDALRLPAAEVDLILLDVQLDGLNGIQGIGLLQRTFRDVPIIILTASREGSDIESAYRQGAHGFLTKSDSVDEILRSIRIVMRGGKAFPGQAGFHADPEQADASRPTLTARQLEVLALLCEGMPNRAIARQLGVSENTVRVHVSAILSAIQVGNRAEAILAAHRLGLVAIP